MSSGPGHPSSVDSMVKLDEDTVLTGGGDGVLRALSVLPNKFLGIVGEDSEGGCDRLAISANSKLLASTSYCSAVRLWNLDEEDDSEQNGSQEDRHTDKVSAPLPSLKRECGPPLSQLKTKDIDTLSASCIQASGKWVAV